MEALEPNYCLLLFGTSVLNLRSALRGITPSNNFKSWFGAGRRRFPNGVKISHGPWRWEQKWYQCVGSQVHSFIISLILSGGQRRNLSLAVAAWPSPEHGVGSVDGDSLLCV